jgi:hypothetical protein
VHINKGFRPFKAFGFISIGAGMPYADTKVLQAYDSLILKKVQILQTLKFD